MSKADDKLLAFIKAYISASFEGRTLYAVRLTLVKNLVWGVLKFAFASATRSLLIGLSALFTGLGGISRAFCFLGLRAGVGQTTARRVNVVVAISLMLSGLFYAAYFLYVLLSAYVFSYPMFVAILIAFFSFIDLAVALRGISKTNGRTLLVKDIKIINLTGALTALVLTSSALLSSAAEGLAYTHVVNGGFGIGVGLVIFGIGIFMLCSPKVYAVFGLTRRYIFEGTHAQALERLGVPLDYADTRQSVRLARKSRLARRHKRGTPAFAVPFAAKGRRAFLYCFDFLLADRTVLSGRVRRVRQKRVLKKWQSVLLWASVIFWGLPYLVYAGVLHATYSVRRYSHVLDDFMKSAGLIKTNVDGWSQIS